jgi:hypothetical protein
VTDDPRIHLVNTIGLAVGAVLLAVLATLLILTFTADLGHQSPIAGDPPIYDAIAEQILDGAIPYIDTPVEHFPGALVPMLLIGGFSRITNISFVAIWPFAMGVLFVVSVAIAGRRQTVRATLTPPASACAVSHRTLAHGLGCCKHRIGVQVLLVQEFCDNRHR